jgi:hypothetical protein
VESRDQINRSRTKSDSEVSRPGSCSSVAVLPEPAWRFAATAIKLANSCYCSTSFPQHRQSLLLALKFSVSANSKNNGNVNQNNANLYLLQMQINSFVSIILLVLCCLYWQNWELNFVNVERHGSLLFIELTANQEIRIGPLFACHSLNFTTFKKLSKIFKP